MTSEIFFLYYAVLEKQQNKSTKIDRSKLNSHWQYSFIFIHLGPIFTEHKQYDMNRERDYGVL